MLRVILICLLLAVPVSAGADDNSTIALMQFESNDILASTLGFGSTAAAPVPCKTLAMVIDIIKEELFN